MINRYGLVKGESIMKFGMKWWVLGVTIVGLVLVWSRSGFNNVDIDTDLGRDLTELSNIWQGKVVWLGPRLSPGLHASSSYYYLFYPFVWLAGGNVRGLFVGSLLLSAIALGWFGYELVNEFGLRAILAVIVIGISYWWDRISFHPGNGFTFATFAFAGLVSLYFNYPLWLSSLLIGMGLAFHPTTAFILPLLIYQWWAHKNRWKELVGIVIGLSLPSAPLIAFEIITKGYVIRNFLAHLNPVIQQALHAGNIATLASFLNLSFGLFVGGWILLGLRVKKRLRVWYWLMTIELPFFVLLTGFSGIYMFAVAAACQFILTVQLLNEKQLGLGLLVAWGIIGATKVGTFVGSPFKVRPLYEIEQAAYLAINSPMLNKNEPMAVVAAISPDTKVPVADDYRFLLRVAGYQVVDSTNYDDAKQLVMFVEVPGFDWQSWSNWELDQFGKRLLVQQISSADTQIMIFNKTN